MFEKFKEELADLSSGTENWAGKLANLGNTFKITQDPILRFVRNVGYGRLGLFRFINNAITNFEVLSTTIGVFKKTFSFAAPIFGAIGGAAAAVGSFKGLKRFESARSKSPADAISNLQKSLNEFAESNNPMKGSGGRNLGKNLMQNPKMFAIYTFSKIGAVAMKLMAMAAKLFLGTFMTYLYATVGAI